MKIELKLLLVNNSHSIEYVHFIKKIMKLITTEVNCVPSSSIQTLENELI